MTESQCEIDSPLREKLELLRPTLPRDPHLAARTRDQFLAEARSLQSRVSPRTDRRDTGRIGRFTSSYQERIAMLRPKQRSALYIAGSLAAALVLLFGGAGMTANTAQAALPGDRFYTVKIALEEAQITFSRDTANDAQLYLKFAQKRLDEMAGLIAAGRLDDLSAAADRFQHDFDHSVSDLRTLAAGNPAEGAALVSASADALARYGQILTGLLETAPQPAQVVLSQAIQASQDSLGSWKVEFTGVVEAIGDSWDIDGQVVAITDQTEIEDSVGLGDLVKVEALRANDGSLTALEIESADEVSDSDESAEFTGRVEIMESTSWTVDGWVVAITDQTEIQGDIGVGDLVKVEALRAADGTLAAKEISLVGNDTTDDDGDDDSSQTEVRFVGEVQEQYAGYWIIGGTTVYLTAETDVDEAVQPGDMVKVEAYESEDGSLIAHEIELVDDDDNNDTDDRDDNDDDDDEMDDSDDDQYEDSDDQYQEDDNDDWSDQTSSGDSGDHDDNDDSDDQSDGGDDSDVDHEDDSDDDPDTDDDDDD